MSIEYFFSLLSPFAYLGNPRLLDIAQKNKVHINYKPINMRSIFPKTGGLPLAKRSEERKKYRLSELKRWSEYLNIPLNPEPKFYPTNEWPATRVVLLAVSKRLKVSDLIKRFMASVWLEEQDISEPRTIKKVVTDSGLDESQFFVSKSTELTLQQKWSANTNEALRNGVFGVPTYIFEGNLYWGQDRLDFLHRAVRTGPLK
jgi:2-hydroxychromene-2-carboxylate isomerase